MVGAVKKWHKSDPERSRDTWSKLSNANSALENQLNLLRKLAAEHADAYQCVIDSCSIRKSEEVTLTSRCISVSCMSTVCKGLVGRLWCM